MRRSRLHTALPLVTALVLVLAVLGLPLFQHTCRMMEDCGDGDLCATLASPTESEEPSCCAEGPTQQEEPSLPSRTQVLPEECCTDVDLTPARQFEAPAFSSLSLPCMDLYGVLPAAGIANLDDSHRDVSRFPLEDPSPPGPPLYLAVSTLLI